MLDRFECLTADGFVATYLTGDERACRHDRGRARLHDGDRARRRRRARARARRSHARGVVAMLVVAHRVYGLISRQLEYISLKSPKIWKLLKIIWMVSP